MSDLPWTPRGLKFIAIVKAVVASACFVALLAMGTALVVAWWRP